MMDELSNTSSMLLDGFLNLPRRAQELLFCCLYDFSNNYAHEAFKECINRDLSEIISPIEQIYYLADIIFSFNGEGLLFDSPVSQQEIQCGSKKYVVDFFYSNSVTKDWAKCYGHEYLYNDINVIVECDGHDFHEKTKQQVKKNNERQLALQLAGYDVIRFSGSQVYENPMKCVKEVHDFIRMKLGIPAESNSRS